MDKKYNSPSVPSSGGRSNPFVFLSAGCKVRAMPASATLVPFHRVDSR